MRKNGFDCIRKSIQIISGSNQIKAAKILGVSKDKLRYRMEQLGIQTNK